MEQTVKACRQRPAIPTYVPKDPSSLPMFFEKKPYQGAWGQVYPLPYCDGISDLRQEVEIVGLTLENEYVAPPGAAGAGRQGAARLRQGRGL